MRTYGETKNCAGCRFWSEMIAKSEGGGPVQALCLAEGSKRGQYTVSRQTCEAWKSGHYGAIDDPPNYGEETRALYAADERASTTEKAGGENG